MTTTKRNRPKLSDLDRLRRAIVELAIQDYCSKLATECPFPNTAEEQKLAAAALIRSCETLNLKLDDEDTYDTALALVIARDSHMRGSLKDKLIPLVRETFGFKNSSSQKAVLHNRKLYDLLRTDNRIVFKDFRNRKGLYETPLIQQAVNIMWFSDPTADGIKFSTYFNPIPIRTITLIFTAVDFIVGRWATGTYRKGSAFTEKEYSEIYQRHVGSLEELRNYNDASAIKLLRIQRRLYARGRDNAGTAATIADQPLLAEDDFDAFVDSSDIEGEDEFGRDDGDLSEEEE